MLNKNKNKNNHANTNNLSDERAQAEAAEARRRGTELVAEHLSHHLEQNPGSSYVTWIATLHPENAEVTIDERFFVPNNPWWTVYEGAKSEIPTAAAVPVRHTETETVAIAQGNDESTTNITSTNASEDTKKERSSGLDLLFGSTLCLVAILTVFGMELTAYICYLISAVFYRLAKAMEPPNACTGILYSVFLLIYWVLALVDSVVLVCSVLVTEIVAASLWLLSSLFASCSMAKRWHQYLRRTCHLLRWAFRSESLSAYPPRQLCCVCLSSDDKRKREDSIPALTEEEKQWTQTRIDAVTVPPPTAPPSTQDVIVVDERDVIVENDHGSSNHKEEPW